MRIETIEIAQGLKWKIENLRDCIALLKDGGRPKQPSSMFETVGIPYHIMKTAPDDAMKKFCESCLPFFIEMEAKATAELEAL